MKQSAFVFSLFLLFFAAHANAQVIPLEQAIEQNLVEFKVEGTGGHSGEAIKLTLINNAKKALRVALSPGYLMASADTTKQDLLVVDGGTYTIRAQKTIAIRLTAFCCRMTRSGPGEGNAFIWKGKSDEKLTAVAAYLYKHNLQTSSLAQAAIWAVSDKADLSAIYDGAQKEKSKALIEMVAGLTGQKVPWYRSVYKKVAPGPQIIHRERMQIHAEWEFELDGNDVLSFNVFDETGKMVATFFSDKKYEPGKYTFSFSYETNKLPKGKYYFRMTGEKKGKVKERELVL